MVRQSIVTLEGVVDESNQREEAEAAVRCKASYASSTKSLSPPAPSRSPPSMLNAQSRSHSGVAADKMAKTSP
jgi:hypothetical protein